MSSFHVFNSALRIKEEPSDVSQSDNDDNEFFDKTLDSKNLQHLRFLRENPIPVLQEYDDNFKDELNEDMKIVFEYEYAKPTCNLAAVKKIDEDSQNHLQDLKHSHIYNTQNTIKVEIEEIVKKELNLNSELSDAYDTREKNDTQKFHRTSHTGKVHNGVKPTCDICGKIFSSKSNLKRHIDMVQRYQISMRYMREEILNEWCSQDTHRFIA